jgi:tRNA (guanine37-N1)-methyltransferase
LQNKEAIHKENNVRLKLNVEKVYFSSRLSEERRRISRLVKNNEAILTMFSGAAPYPATISKNTRAREIIGIEINPIAHKYALENLKLNKIRNVKLILGNVKNEVPRLKKKFDRIIMPLPRGAENFLDLAFKVAKKGTIIHLYQFINEEEFEATKQKLKNICNKNKINCKILGLVRCGQFSPRVYRVCIDFKVL